MYINAKPKKSLLTSILFFTLILTLTTLTSSLFAAATSVVATKTVDNATPAIGSQIEYTITVTNSGTTTLSDIIITESALPAGLTYVASSSSHSGPGGGYTITPVATIATEPATGLSWEIDGLIAGGEVVITYKADVSATGTLANSGTVNHSSLATAGIILNVSVAATSTPTSYTFYIPIIFKSPPGVTLSAIPYTSGASSWTLTWPASTETGVTYQVQEADNESFSSPTLLTATSNTITRTGITSSTGELYYRVRAVQNGVNGAWSNVEEVSFEYFDAFTSSTGWEIRRNNESDIARTITNGNLKVTSDSIWSNVIVSPLVKAPGSDYTITTNALMHQRQDNHHFGIVFGGKHNGSGCTATSGETTDCFEEFYILDVQHRYVAGSSLYDPAIYEFKIERINYTSENRFNRIEEITNWKSTSLDVADSHEWEIDVNADGSFAVSVGGDELKTGTVDDVSLLSNGYFGVIVMADGNGSARTDFADFRVEAD